MGNPQQTERTFKIGWLVGAIEGEGMVAVYRSTAKTAQKPDYKPVIKIYNTDERFIKRTLDYLTELEIPHHVYESKPRIASTGKEYRTLYSISIQGIKRCKVATTVLEPELFSSKRQRMSLLKKLVDMRLAVPMTRANYGRGWVKEELDLIEAIKNDLPRGYGSRMLNDYTQSAANNAVKI